MFRLDVPEGLITRPVVAPGRQSVWPCKTGAAGAVSSLSLLPSESPTSPRKRAGYRRGEYCLPATSHWCALKGRRKGAPAGGDHRRVPRSSSSGSAGSVSHTGGYERGDYREPAIAISCSSTRLAGFDDQAGTAGTRESAFDMDAPPEVDEACDEQNAGSGIRRGFAALAGKTGRTVRLGAVRGGAATGYPAACFSGFPGRWGGPVCRLTFPRGPGGGAPRPVGRRWTWNQRPNNWPPWIAQADADLPRFHDEDSAGAP